MALREQELEGLLHELASRPGHEKVRSLIYQLLTQQLGCASTTINFEKPLPEVRGRVDALLGHTVLEFKRNLKEEKKDAEEELGRYLPERERQTNQPHVGIATDGLEYAVYAMREGLLDRFGAFTLNPAEPRVFLAWLDGTLSLTDHLPPDPDTMERELGRSSLTYWRASAVLKAAWENLRGNPEAVLKRDLWAMLLRKVYGAPVDSDELFFQHTYLTILAKAIAHAVMDLGAGLKPKALMDGSKFSEIGLNGVVESDFFDWVLADSAGKELVLLLLRQASRFRLGEVQGDVLKGLYESLVDPRQRHDLGEYYTPDWLAAMVCERAITNPLHQRVLDPACGSGSFLFHAIQRAKQAAAEKGLSADEIIQCTSRNVLGIDIHPVAVLFARVTWLLAHGPDLLKQCKGGVSVPVYLADAMQWNTTEAFGDKTLTIEVPDGPSLTFPEEICADSTLFDNTINKMVLFSEKEAGPENIRAWLVKNGISHTFPLQQIAKTYEALKALRQAGRNHIWGYVARNQARPVWLSSENQKVDVIVGNPPWVAYRFLSPEFQEMLKNRATQMGVWVGGKLATQSDLSAYFYAQSARLYLKSGGVIAMVLPLAALSRGQYQKFLKGQYDQCILAFTEAWTFDETVQPLFPVPSAVLLAQRNGSASLPASVTAYSGSLPTRNSPPQVAQKKLSKTISSWPGVSEFHAVSIYRDKFKNGATLFPRKLCFVVEVPVGKWGRDESNPLVQSRESTQDKEPWKNLDPLRRAVEKEFLRSVYLGESVLPFRLLKPQLAVIPWGKKSQKLLSAKELLAQGCINTCDWVSETEELWKTHGKGKTTFSEQLDFYRKLSSQFPISKIRVVYTKAGKQSVAVVVKDVNAVMDHKLYWAKMDSMAEARYLTAIFNSPETSQRFEHRQSKGQWGARDIDKVVFELNIPLFDASNDLHVALARAAEKAEKVAALVELKEGEHFVRARKRVREALTENGVAAEMDDLVAQLLG